jgi:hypothetical protein
MQPMFDAWAGSAHIQLHPGTVYLCASSPVNFPQAFISLAEFEHLHGASNRRGQTGYSPRLYPVAIADCLLGWVYRWSEDDPELGFVGSIGSCDARKLLEVLCTIGVKRAFGTGPLDIRFIAA